jgi:hypothetical protein
VLLEGFSLMVSEIKEARRNFLEVYSSQKTAKNCETH